MSFAWQSPARDLPQAGLSGGFRAACAVAEHTCGPIMVSFHGDDVALTGNPLGATRAVTTGRAPVTSGECRKGTKGLVLGMTEGVLYCRNSLLCSVLPTSI